MVPPWAFPTSIPARPGRRPQSRRYLKRISAGGSRPPSRGPSTWSRAYDSRARRSCRPPVGGFRSTASWPRGPGPDRETECAGSSTARRHDQFRPRLSVFSVSAALERARRLPSLRLPSHARRALPAETGRGASLNGEPVGLDGLRSREEPPATGFPTTSDEAPSTTSTLGPFIVRPAIRRAARPALDLAYVALRPFRRLWGAQAQALGRGPGPLLVAEPRPVTDFSGAAFALESPGIVASKGPIHPDIVEV